MQNTRKIHALSKLLQHGCLGIAVLLVGFQLYFTLMIRLNPALVMPVVTERAIANTIASAEPLGYWLASLVYLLPTLALAYGIWHLSRMFNGFANGNYFTEQSVAHLLIFSLVGFVTQLLGPVVQALAGLLGRLGKPENFLELNITIDQEGIIQLIAWATFFVVAWIMREGTRLAKENAEFI